MPKMRIKTGDTVELIAGKDRSKRGKVLRVLPDERRLVVEKLNIVKRHTKPRPAPRDRGGGQAGVIPGGVIEKEAPLHASNVLLVCPNCGKASRFGVHVNARGDKVRVCRRCDRDID